MAISLTKKAEDKVKEILLDQPETFAGLRIQVVGGGCSGFQYRMGFDKNYNDQNDSVFEFDGLKVFVDKSSLLYMDGAEVDYIEGLHGAGFKFNNPNVSAGCGCVSPFRVYQAPGGALKAERLGGNFSRRRPLEPDSGNTDEGRKTCQIFPASTRVYASGVLNSAIRVPFRDISLKD